VHESYAYQKNRVKLIDLAAQSIGADPSGSKPTSSRTLHGTAGDPGMQVPGLEGIASLIVPLPPPLKDILFVQIIPANSVVPRMLVVAHGAQINMAVEAFPNKSKVCVDEQLALLGLGIPLICKREVGDMAAKDPPFLWTIDACPPTPMFSLLFCI
jgi:hypothetical protein